ncbi:S8 family serine peptidase [Quadrisphaera sp. DSM 44207]|uniref:S8 family peptidase n=1 Tax=Quadrisphaera sp. DSM 44207 TaxID=1881057 RepID=UPI00087EA99F|nr:S8 family serine peptidase [Quadrisphaera sp. DSM 44207]SDQ08261.1 Subtilase family protein [Quadrisphaera sp. DSM 44207]
MARTYTILREAGRPRTASPFDLAAPRALAAEGVDLALVDVAELGKAELADVARDPQVRAVAPVMPTTLVRPRAGEAPQEAGGATWGVQEVGADTSARTGAGVLVAVLDTGVEASHPAFAGVELVEEDFSGAGTGDREGHGTHVAGTVFGRDVEGTRIGVAPGVQRALIGKILGDDGSGESDMVFRGIQWAVSEGAQVVSMSIGFDFPGLVAQLVADGWPTDLATSAALEAYRGNLRMFDALMAVVRARSAFGTGAIVVAAAGNESQRDVDPSYEIAAALPAAAEGVVSVGALARSPEGLVVAPFSNTFPQVSAPGVDVLSAALGGGLVSLSGTSMATPHVAGVAALWWEQVLASPLPATAATVLAQLVGSASYAPFAPDVDVADRGVGLVRAP